jgi:hypothetical protein
MFPECSLDYGLYHQVGLISASDLHTELSASTAEAIKNILKFQSQMDTSAAQMGSLEEMVRQTEAQGNALIATLASLADVTNSFDNETATEAAAARIRTGTDEEGRCKAFRDVYGSAYLTFTVDKFAKLTVSTDQAVEGGVSNPNLGRRLHQEEGIQEDCSLNVL